MDPQSSIKVTVKPLISNEKRSIIQRYRRKELLIPVMYHGETNFSEEKKQSLDEALGWMDIYLTGRPWLAGAHMTIADFACSVSLSNIVAIDFDISKYKKISEWFVRCKKEIPGFEESLEGAEQFGKAMKSNLVPYKI